MSPMAELVLAMAALITLVICAFGVLSSAYDDTATQCTGMGLAGCGSAVTLWQVVNGGSQDHALMLTAVGVAVYAVGTFIKRWRRRQRTS